MWCVSVCLLLKRRTVDWDSIGFRPMELFAQSYSLLLPKTHTWFPFQTESALHTLSKAHHSVFQSILFRQQTSQKLFLFLHLKKKKWKLSLCAQCLYGVPCKLFSHVAYQTHWLCWEPTPPHAWDDLSPKRSVPKRQRGPTVLCAPLPMRLGIIVGNC